MRRYIASAEVEQYRDHEAVAKPAPVRHIDVPLFVDSDRYGGVQDIHLSIADVDSPKGLILAPVAWSDYGKRPFQEIRLGSMARFANARVVGLDFPGMGDTEGGRRDELTEKQLEEAAIGRFHNVTANYWQALIKEGLLEDEDGNPLPVAFWGHSLSTLTVAEMAANAPEGVGITDLYTSEIMALEQASPTGTAFRFMTKGAKDLKRYQAMNEHAPPHRQSGVGGLISQVARQRQSHSNAFRALTKGQHAAVVGGALAEGRLSFADEHATRLHVVRAQAGLTAMWAATWFVRELQNVRGQSNIGMTTLTAEYHGYQDSLPALLHQMSQLALVQAQAQR